MVLFSVGHNFFEIADSLVLTLEQLVEHVEAHEVLARQDADDAVGRVNDDEVAHPKRPEEDVSPVERERLVHTRYRMVDKCILASTRQMQMHRDE